MSIGMMHFKRTMALCVLLLGIVGCDQVWNSPHEAESFGEKIGYSSFSEPPKTLDPAKSYSADEIRFTAQIYEPLLQYDYLKRPYTLVPLVATQLPEVQYFNKEGQLLPADDGASQIATSLYTITIKPKIYYYPHPGFARDQNGRYLYQQGKESELENIDTLEAFSITSTRELLAEDYVYEIKRLADPRISSPIYGLMSQYIVGMKEFHDQILTLMKNDLPIDLRTLEISGVKSLDSYHLQIKLHGKYEQFNYWLAMPFFSPIPWEVDQFFNQPGMSEHNLKLSWYPVGTGPYYLAENNPNQRMVLRQNPFYRDDYFPAHSDDPTDIAKGYLIDAGKKLPLVKSFVFSLEKETIPRWNKFLQGYYDSSAIGSDSFDQAIQIDKNGEPDLTPEMKALGLRLQTVVTPSIYYLGFNMLDPVVGSNSEKGRKLRQAISAAIDFDEYIAIFDNGRGVVAQGPIPPGIYGYTDDKNPITQQNLQQAKQWLAEAGYPNGRELRTGEPLLLNYDATSTSGPDDKARFDWMRKQFAKLGVELNIRSTDYNRFQEKMRTGGAQIFMWGWNADYPDPENFLFLLYGPNGKVKFGGENASNYFNAEFDQLFDKMKSMSNSAERQEIIKKMIDIVRQDAPWVFGVFPKEYVLDHQWVYPQKLNVIANNTLKYVNVDAQLREKLIQQWNKPKIWPIVLLFFASLLIMVPVIVSYLRRERSAIKEKK